MSAHAGALEAIDRILNRGGATDEVVGQVLAVLHERLFRWAGLVSADGALRAEVGERPAAAPSLRAPVAWQGTPLAELQAEPRLADDGDRALLARVALVLSPYLR
jgi:hypothetical protein